MAYMFNDDKTKFPFIRDLLWSGNDEEESVTEWEYEGSDHGVNLGDYSEFEIHTQEGAILRLSGTGVLLCSLDGTALINRYCAVDGYLNTAYVGQCKVVGSSGIHNDWLIPIRFYGIKVGATDLT